jgi:phenylacetate-coenzyme A ligase PaaK-like adenylate-forming protein
MNKTFMPDFQNRDQLFDHQLKGLKWTVAHAYNGSAFYKKQFENADVTPADINSLDDLARLPFTTGKDLKEGLIILGRENLSNLTPHPLYSFFHYSHPTLGERVRAVDKELSRKSN